MHGRQASGSALIGMLRRTAELTVRILRPSETAARVGLCDRELRDLERAGMFPRRFPLNPSGKGRAVGHLEHEVDAWIEARAATREIEPAA